MEASVNLFSEKDGEIERFLNLFYEKKIELDNKLFWQKKYDNPINMIEIISTYTDNSEQFDIGLWICLDENIFININDITINNIIKYLLERYPN